MRLPYEVKLKQKPKWFEFRRQLARGLVWMAKKIYPASPEALTFYMDVAIDAAIYGRSIVRVGPREFEFPIAEQLNPEPSPADYFRNVTAKDFSKLDRI